MLCLFCRLNEKKVTSHTEVELKVECFSETMQNRRQGGIKLKSEVVVVSVGGCHQRILCVEKISFENKREIKPFSNKKKRKEKKCAETKPDTRFLKNLLEKNFKSRVGVLSLSNS